MISKAFVIRIPFLIIMFLKIILKKIKNPLCHTHIHTHTYTQGSVLLKHKTYVRNPASSTTCLPSRRQQPGRRSLRQEVRRFAVHRCLGLWVVADSDTSLFGFVRYVNDFLRIARGLDVSASAVGDVGASPAVLGSLNTVILRLLPSPPSVRSRRRIFRPSRRTPSHIAFLSSLCAALSLLTICTHKHTHVTNNRIEICFHDSAALGIRGGVHGSSLYHWRRRQRRRRAKWALHYTASRLTYTLRL